MRGEYVIGNIHENPDLGSPLHAWGILTAIKDYLSGLRITPTCVGNTASSQHYQRLFLDHPYMRGEYSCRITPKITASGSPLHAWGIH